MSEREREREWSRTIPISIYLHYFIISIILFSKYLLILKILNQCRFALICTLICISLHLHNLYSHLYAYKYLFLYLYIFFSLFLFSKYLLHFENINLMQICISSHTHASLCIYIILYSIIYSHISVYKYLFIYSYY